MSDEKTLRYRPPGDLRVEIFKPMMRFGIGLKIGVVTSEAVYYATVENGEFVWTRMDPNIAPEYPTLYMDEELLNAVYLALTKQPVQTRGQAAYDHLQDAMQVRDRLLKLIEDGWSR